MPLLIGLLCNLGADRRYPMGISPNKLRIGLITAIFVAGIILYTSKSRTSWHWSSDDPADVVPVLVANRYIPAFAVIKPDMVRIQEFPKELIPPGALQAKAELINEKQKFKLGMRTISCYHRRWCPRFENREAWGSPRRGDFRQKTKCKY